MSEIQMNFDGIDRKLTPENTVLMIHKAGKTAIDGTEYSNNRFDCIVHTDEMKMIIFREQFAEFNQVASYMIENGYEALINKRTVGKVALGAYFTLMDRRVESAMEQFDDDVKGILEGDNE